MQLFLCYVHGHVIVCNFVWRFVIAFDVIGQYVIACDVIGQLVVARDLTDWQLAPSLSPQDSY